MLAWKLAAVVAGLAVGGFAAALYWFSRKWIVAPRVAFDAPGDEHVEEARFTTADGIALHGWLLPGEPGRPALVLCHGYQRCMEEPFALAVELRERGFSVLLFDFRGCGRSGGRYTTIGHDEKHDLLAAVRWLRGRLGEGAPIGALGISMGGAVVIEAAAACPEIGAVVADSAFAHLSGAVAHRFRTLGRVNLVLHQTTMRVAERMVRGRVARVRPVDAIGRIAPRPVLLVHGTADGIVPLSHAHELRAAAGEPAELWLLEGTSHAMPRFDAADEYVERVATFFEAALGPA
jgi:alpha-beta hydrolase superfamily lysophospholipase